MNSDYPACDGIFKDFGCSYLVDGKCTVADLSTCRSRFCFASCSGCPYYLESEGCRFGS